MGLDPRRIAVVSLNPRKPGFQPQIRKVVLGRNLSISSLWSRVRLPLAIIAMFFATWGPGLQVEFGFDPSKIFVGLSVLFVACWLIFERDRLNSFPRLFTLYVVFVLLHTLVVYGVFFPEELSFSYTGSFYHEGGILVLQEGVGLKILRFVLFALFGYALSAASRTERDFRYLAMAYGLGFAFVTATGGYATTETAYRVLRFAGGALDPNALGQSAMVASFFALLMMVSGRTFRLTKVIGIAILGFAVVALIRSGSRGALVGFLAGLAFFIIRLPGIGRRYGITLSLVLLFLIVLVLIGFEPFDNFLERMTLATLVRDRGAGRLDIWIDYLTYIGDYWLTGVGFGKMMDVIQYAGTRIEATHNNYLGVWVEFGIVGLGLFLSGLIVLWKRLQRLIQEGGATAPVLQAMFVAWLVHGCFIDTLATREAWIILSLIAASPKAISDRRGVS